MDLYELRERLPAFCREKYGRDDLRIVDVVKMPGHAGFAYGFRVELPERLDGWFLRLPPPHVNWVGTADVLRQVAALQALDATDVPHCSVVWSGHDLRWFGRPYFVVPQLSGDVLRLNAGEWGSSLTEERKLDLGRQAMKALAGVHGVDLGQLTYLGDPVPFTEDVTRWDRFYERAADPERLRDVPEIRRKLLDRLPDDASVGLCHGDFQIGNLFCSADARLLAVIDWELCGIGATQNDVGWIATFSDSRAWARGISEGPGSRPFFLDPETLLDLYREALGRPLVDMNWFRALAAYKFAIITGFNLSLHRRGKRDDPLWEQLKLSMTPLIDRARELLG